MEEKKELLDQDERVVEIELERLRGFVNHPFKVQADSQMIELQESIKKYGILNPLIVRPRQDGSSDILDEDRRKNAELMENAFYNKENLNPQMKEQDEGSSTITVPDGVDAELLMKVLGNPEMVALLTSLAKTMKV